MPSAAEAGKISKSHEGNGGDPRFDSPLSGRDANSEFFDRTLPASSAVVPTTAIPVDYPPRPPERSIVIPPKQVLPSRGGGAAKPSGGAALELALAPGVREPTVLLVPPEKLTAAQAQALAAAMETFVDRVEAAATSSIPEENLAKVWEKEKAEADATYRNLFGDAALHQQTTEAAVRALGFPTTAQGGKERGAVTK